MRRHSLKARTFLLALAAVCALAYAAGPAGPAALAAAMPPAHSVAVVSGAASTGPPLAPGASPSLNIPPPTPPVVQQPAAPVPAPSAPATANTSSGGISGLDAVIIAIAALGLLAVIGFWVRHDAHKHTAGIRHGAGPGSGDPMFSGRTHAGSKTPQKQRKLKPAERKRRKRGRAR